MCLHSFLYLLDVRSVQMNAFCIVLLLYGFCAITTAQRRKRAACTPTVELQCDEHDNKRFTYYVYNEHAEIKPGCSDNKITSVDWALISMKTQKSVLTKQKSFKTSKTERTLTIPARVAPSGQYKLQLVVTETGGGKTTATCPFNYISEPPVIIFKSGQLQYVLTGTAYTVDITPSRLNGVKSPQIKWSVKCLYNEDLEEFCRKTLKCENAAPMKGLKFIGFMNKCFDDLTFTAAMLHEDFEVSATHVVTPRKFFSCKVDVICEKNCDKGGSHLSNPDLNIVLKLKPANLNCWGFDSWRPKWIVQGAKRLSASEMEIVNENKRLIIKENVLKRDESVSVLALVKDKFEAWFRVHTIPKIRKPRCQIEPKSGISLETKFKVTCITKDKHLKTYGPYYTVYQTVNGKKNLVTSTADPTFDMLLSSVKGQPTQTLIIEGRDIFHNTFECRVDPVTVTEAELTKESIKENMDTLIRLTNDGNPLSPQHGAALLNEVNQQNVDKKLAKEVKAKIMKALSNMNIDTMATYEQVASIATSFVDVNNMTQKYKENLAVLCKRLGTIHLKELHKDVYVKYQETTAKTQAELNANCGNKLLEETKDDDEIEIEVTTMPDVEPVIKEDYPDYHLPFANPEAEIIKDTALDIITESAKAVATTLSGGEHFVQKTNNSESMIAVEQGKYMAAKRIESGAITVIPSDQFKDEGENLITAIVSNYDRDVLMPQSDLSSNIVEVHFFKGSTNIQGTSYDITFPVLNDTVPYDKYEVQPLQPGDQFLQIDRKMNVHRLELFAMETCLIRFKIDEEVKLSVALAVNQRPRQHHFQEKRSAFIVDGANNNTWTIENPYARSERDTLFYVAVMPHRDMLTRGPKTMPYEVQFTQIACVIYRKAKHKWVPTDACSVRVNTSETGSIVHCMCSKTSLHSVFYQPIPNKLDEQIDIDYLIVDCVNYVIYVHVLVVLLVYAVALALSLRRQTKVYSRDNIFFLSDNLKNDRFCYMLVIRTGSYTYSGTTANIMTQLIGAKGTSKPHVLNYPDPACKLLQRDSINWMILAHSEHLGDLQSILLWTDGIGLFPAWYCQDITIFDLQLRKSYLFKVENWLSPLDKHFHYLRVQVSKAEQRNEREKLSLVKHLRFHYKGRHTWNIFVHDDEEITYVERLSVVLSMILTVYMVVMWLLRPPTLKRSDSFGYGEFQYYTETFFFAFASSFISSAMHLTMVYFLRNSKLSDVTRALVLPVKRYSYKVRRIIRYVLMAWICICLIYLITFGFWVPVHSIFQWTIITFLSLLISIIVWENIFIICVDIITSHVGYVEPLEYKFDEIITEIERQRKILFRKFGEVLMRPYFRKHYRLLTPDERFNLRQLMIKRLEVARLFKDMCLFILYITILYCISVAQYDTSFNKSNKMMHKIVKESIYANRTYMLDDIEHISDIYDYLEFVIIPTIHPTKWYGKWYASDAGLLADFATRIIGVVQLRQQRRMQKCRVPQAIAELKIPCTNYAPIFDHWEYNDGSNITSTIGHYKIYDGSGYIAYLGRTLRNSKYILELLRRYNWIDINTAVFFIDFLAYNANLNMFNAVRITIEHSPTGRYRKSAQIITTSLVFTNIYLEVTVAFLYIALIIIIIVMLIKRFVQILVLKRKYFNDFWNLLDVSLCILSIALVTLFFLRKSYTEDLLKTMAETDNNKFVNYYHLITISEALVITYGLTLSLATLRLWKFLHFGVLFRIMERAILKAGPQLFGLFIYQICVYLMMVSFIYPMYGENMEAFRDYYTALVTMYLASINFTEHLANIYTSMNTSYLYLVYSLYLIISLCFLNLYATTLIINLEESKIYYSNATHIYSIHNYVMDIFYFYKEKLRRHLEATRLKGGGSPSENFQVDVDKLVFPKAEEHRYADLISMNKRKMNLMKLIAIAAVKNIYRYGRRTELTEEDYSHMAQIVLNLAKTPSDETEERLAHVFFKGRDPTTGRIRFIPDIKLLQMEMVVKKLLEGKEEEINIEQDVQDMVIHQSGGAQTLKNMHKCLELILNNVRHIIVVDDKSKLEKVRRDNRAEQVKVDIETHSDEAANIVGEGKESTKSDQADELKDLDIDPANNEDKPNENKKSVTDEYVDKNTETQAEEKIDRDINTEIIDTQIIDNQTQTATKVNKKIQIKRKKKNKNTEPHLNINKGIRATEMIERDEKTTEKADKTTNVRQKIKKNKEQVQENADKQTSADVKGNEDTKAPTAMEYVIDNEDEALEKVDKATNVRQMVKKRKKVNKNNEVHENVDKKTAHEKEVEKDVKSQGNTDIVENERKISDIVDEEKDVQKTLKK